MPLIALHLDLGALDATLPDLGAGLNWAVVHRARPRAALECRGCGGSLQAKVSKLGLRFFAHDAANSECPTNGETAAHRLLKSELAAAIRLLGWTAQLEVPGSGWQADVLAISPDGQRRLAWEAQLASATAQDLGERTDVMLRELDGVCWVTDRDVPWVARVPSARIKRNEESGELEVVDGTGRFEPDWCQRRSRCEWGSGLSWLSASEPCAGHGMWEIPAGFTLHALVAAVCLGRLRVHETREYRRGAGFRHPGGTIVWTARHYVELETEQVLAREEQERRQAEADAAEDRHRQNVAALLKRQRALIPTALALVGREFDTHAEADNGDRDPQWAMGVPVSAASRVRAVICPVATRIDASVAARLADVTVLVASREELDRVALHCLPSQRIVLASVSED